LKNQLDVKTNFIGNSSAVDKIKHVIAKVAATDTAILIEGESGTGKEVVAQMIHKASPRRDKHFIPVNCGALPENLLESELFGHEKGSFTGATNMRRGLFEEANGGTIFLDEIGETSQATQVKLLRVLQEGKVRRVGSNQEIPFDARLICATNQDIVSVVREGRFRQDLFYRLNVVNIKLPPLRERTGDIPLLVRYFLEKFNDKNSIEILRVSNEVMELFQKHTWPGNVRELVNVIEAATAMCDNEVIEASDLPSHFHVGDVEQSMTRDYTDLTYEQAKAIFEKDYFSSLLNNTDYNIKDAASKAGVSEKSISRRKQEFGIRKE
jgi:transcriptional regulator with PAS, ATPase and Fis domain